MKRPPFTVLPRGYRFEHDLGRLPIPTELARVSADIFVRRPHLYDGDVVSVRSIATDVLTATTASYGHFLAERSAGAESGARYVRPLAVTGITTVSGLYAFGRRSSSVTQEAGLIEFAPSGGIDASRIATDGSLDIVGQLVAELIEECGVSPTLQYATEIVALVEDDANHVVDVVCRIEVEATPEAFLAGYMARASGEYEELFLVEPTELAERSARWRGALGAVTETLLTAYILPDFQNR